MRFRVAFPEESVKIAAQSIMASYHTPIKTRRASERDGILFWILPPLLLGAIFAFCAMANGDGMEKGEAEPAAAEVSDEE